MILEGDAVKVLRTLAAGSARCVVTSPPYWGLRDYGVVGQLGLEAVPDCMAWTRGVRPCRRCYICKMVRVFDEVRRVLADNGTLWLNMGDSYAGSWDAQSRGLGSDPRNPSRLKGSGLAKRHILSSPSANPKSFRRDRAAAGGLRHKNAGLKPKDMVGMPWRLALALQARGWWLRQDIVWQKPNPMPESIRDRCTKAHEYIFLLAKSQRYLYNRDAIAEPSSPDSHARYARGRSDTHKNADGGPGNQTIKTNRPGSLFAKRVPANWHQGKRGAEVAPQDQRAPGVNPKAEASGRGTKQNASYSAAVRDLVEFRNKRSVWTFATMPTAEAHFATFPIELAETCILAGSNPGDAVLDPFAGIGTTGLAALKHGRAFVGIELNPKYIKLLKEREARIMPLLA